MRRVRTCCVCRKRFVTASGKDNDCSQPLFPCVSVCTYVCLILQPTHTNLIFFVLGSQICPNCRPNHDISVNDDHDHDEKIQIESSNNYNNKDVMKHNDESKPPKKKKKNLKEEDTIIKTNPIIDATTMAIQRNETPCCIENKNTATHEMDEKSNEKESGTFYNMKSTVPEKRGDDDHVCIRNEYLHPKNQKVIDVELYSKDNNYDMHHQRVLCHEAIGNNYRHREIDDNTPKKKSIDTVTTDIGARENESDHLLSVEKKSTIQNNQQSSNENGEKFATNPLLQYDTDLQNTKELKKIPKQQQDGTICFICGKRFVGGLKSKVNHMKRCSKQQGISIKDFKQDCDDEDYFLSPDETNKYGKKDWHNPELSSKLSTQATLTNYFTNPKKSVHQVLMAGAKRMAKTSSILLQKQQNHNIIPKQKKQWKRRRINNQSYTNVSTLGYNLCFLEGKYTN